MPRLHLTLGLTLGVFAAAAPPPPSLITSLPDIPDFPSAYPPLYGGYLPHTRDNFTIYTYHLLVRAVSDSAAPLLVWYNGGPGCSGLYGFGYENGPFTLTGPTSTPSFSPNALSLSAIGGGVNVLYIEQPAGVGFSYSDPPSYASNDVTVALDNVAILKSFLEAYPDFKGRQTWLVGESYAGQYIPELGYSIMTGDDSELDAQIVGWILGNPAFACEDGVGFQALRRAQRVDAYYWHGLLPLSFVTAYKAAGCDAVESPPAECEQVWDPQMTALAGPLNPNDLYQSPVLNGSLGLWTSTSDINVLAAWTGYLNRVDVQAAIHANPPPAGAWINCTHWINYTRFDTNNVPQYQLAAARGKRVLIYSGDVDIDVVPTGITQTCVEALNYTVTTPWSPWVVNNQTAGFVVEYSGSNFSFATVKGAGHEVPAYQPLAAFHMMERFIFNGSLLAGRGR